MYRPELTLDRNTWRRTCLTVGVGANVPGMSTMARDGRREGFDVDFGRAFAAVLFCDADAVEFVTISPTDRFQALHDGAIDVGLFNASCTHRRELANDVVFPAISLIDGEGVLIRRAKGVNTLKALHRPVIAAQKGTTTRANLERFLRGRVYCVDEFPQLSEALDAYLDGYCDALVFDSIILAALRAGLSDSDDHVILDERLSREAMGPVVLRSRVDLANVVRWTVNALVLAEEVGLSRSALDGIVSDVNDDGPAARLLNTGLALTDDDELAIDRLRILIASVGHYGEIFDRHIGAQSALKMPRGANAPFHQGGSFLPPPIH